MKPLAERHADRAQRKADNMAESQDASNYTGGLGDAMNKIADAQTALAGLSPNQREELKSAFEANLAEGADGFRSLAEEGNDAPGLSLAGIGTVDTRVTPFAAIDKAGAAMMTGELPAASFDPANGNLNGLAVEAAGTPASAAGWGTTGAQGGNGGGSTNDGYGALTLTELKAEADGRTPPVPYPAKVKDDQAGKDGIIAGLRAANAAAAKASDNS